MNFTQNTINTYIKTKLAYITFILLLKGNDKMTLLDCLLTSIEKRSENGNLLTSTINRNDYVVPVN